MRNCILAFMVQCVFYGSLLKIYIISTDWTLLSLSKCKITYLMLVSDFIRTKYHTGRCLEKHRIEPSACYRSDCDLIRECNEGIFWRKSRKHSLLQESICFSSSCRALSDNWDKSWDGTLSRISSLQFIWQRRKRSWKVFTSDWTICWYICKAFVHLVMHGSSSSILVPVQQSVAHWKLDFASGRKTVSFKSFSNNANADCRRFKSSLFAWFCMVGNNDEQSWRWVCLRILNTRRSWSHDDWPTTIDTSNDKMSSMKKMIIHRRFWHRMKRKKMRRWIGMI